MSAKNPKPLPVQPTKRCERCAGHGHVIDHDKRPRTCNVCNGSGQVPR